MAIMNDIRTMFRRRKPVVVDLTGTQAEALAAAARSDGRPNGSPMPSEDREPPDRRGRNGRSELPVAYQDAIDTISRIGDHLDGQSRRTDRLLELMERLPQAIDALPEINRQNARLLEAIIDHLDHAKTRDHALDQTLSGIADSSGRQTEVLGLIQQQLDRNNDTSDGVATSLSTFRNALDELSESNRHSLSTLSELTSVNQSRENELATMLSRTERWTVMAMVFCGVASIAAVVLALATVV